MNPRGVPIPPRPRLDRRDSGVTAAVWGKVKYLMNPRGVPIPPRPRLDRRDSGRCKEKYLTKPRRCVGGPEGLGCNTCGVRKNT